MVQPWLLLLYYIFLFRNLLQICVKIDSNPIFIHLVSITSMIQHRVNVDVSTMKKKPAIDCKVFQNWFKTGSALSKNLFKHLQCGLRRAAPRNLNRVEDCAVNSIQSNLQINWNILVLLNRFNTLVRCELTCNLMQFSSGLISGFGPSWTGRTGLGNPLSSSINDI